jgi:serine/threonine protein kinase
MEIWLQSNSITASNPLRRRIISLFDVDATSPTSWIVLPVIQGPPLADILDNPKYTIPEALAFHVFLQLAEALHFLHKLTPFAIAHGNVHEGNIMLDPSHCDVVGFPNVVLIDFGIASTYDRSTSCVMGQGIRNDIGGFARLMRKLTSQIVMGRGTSIWCEDLRMCLTHSLWRRM